ncbi:hypothetical protein C1H46_021799 [Malus baccata]|uniref:S1-like domain-containing protein n=1 Tax=Malus baccata TaxID=106549 RepID=A0A540K2K2_MALBA|nr:hypothetical protein C1H46_021799 [Malus baccata]
MPKNKSNGGKNRKRGKNEADEEKRELVFKKDGQLLRMLGNGRREAMCVDGRKRPCHIRRFGSRNVWISADDIIFAGLRDCQDDKADVLLKYMPDEARRLKAFGELPEKTRLDEDENEGGADDYVEFQDEDIGIKYTRFSDQNSIHLLKDVIFYRF